jgi:eukaryotic-like serine/threonine-protein kinase
MKTADINADVCPDAGTLAALLESETPEGATVYATHLDNCVRCRQTLAELAADSTSWEEAARYLPRIGSSGSGPLPVPEPVLERLLAHLKAESPFLPEKTEVPLGEELSLSFLRAAERPGLLGYLGTYEVQEVIGRGGMGVVFKAFDPALHRTVAIKVMAAVALLGSATARRRFAREAQAAAAVCHENVVTVYGVHEEDGLPYLVMQYVAGESLQTRLERAGPLEVMEIVRVGLQTASGLAAAHAQGLIHRDIKPANLLLENGLARVRITDFGLVRMADDVQLTQNGVAIGTPEYMAPEQARGEPVDHRGDLFSLGSVLYACCAGRPPFLGSTPLALLRQVSDETPAPIQSLNPAIPIWLEAFIARLMAKDPAKRFQSATEVAELLEGYLAHLRQPTTIVAPEFPSPLSDRSSGPVVQTKFVPWSRKPRFVAALLLLAVLGLGGGWATIHFLGAGNEANPQAEAVKGAAVPVRRLHGHTGTVTQLQFTADGQRLVSASGWPGNDNSVRVWNPATGQELLRITVPGPVEAMDLSRDGKLAIAGLSNGPILCLDLETGQTLNILQNPRDGGVSWVAFAADGHHVFATSKGGMARLWDLDVGTEVQHFRTRGTWALFGGELPDGRLLTVDNTGLLQLWNVASGTEVKRLEVGPDWVSSLALMHDGRHAVVGTAEASLWDLETGQKTSVFEGHEAEVHHAMESPDGRWLLTAGFDSTIRLWDFQTGAVVRVLGSHEEMVFTAVFSPDGRFVASGGGGRRDSNSFQPGTDHDIRLWEVTALSAEAAGVQRSWGDEWLVAAVELLGLAIMLACGIGVGVWLYVRRRRRRTVAPLISLSCSTCGKKLRARAELAGKKVKCTQCGQAVLVPNVT